MGAKIILVLAFILLVIFLLFFYWFVPFETISFTPEQVSSNFSAVGEDVIQFYPNMRFPSPRISYGISNCPLSKKNEMESAFEIIENLTILEFYPMNNAEIFVSCEERSRMENGLFIAGEGGPTNITLAGDFYAILSGEILLIRESKCSSPNIAIHELLHVLGFDHSSNPNNIMYNFTRCDQTIGEDVIELINNLYSAPSYPDLIFRNVTATMNGKFLDLNLTIVNAGLGLSEESSVSIYADENFVKEINIEPLDIGYGRFISIKHLWVPQIDVNEISLVINYGLNEINKENNKIKLKIKNN